MSVQVRRRREAASFLSTYVGAQGELIVDTTNNRIQVHDGATPGGWPAAKLADLVVRTPVADAAYAAKASDRTVAITSLTAPRTITLPSAASFPTGATLTIVDESGACATIAIAIAAAGTDTINGLAAWPIATAYGYVALESNGIGRWTVIDTPGVSRTSVADAGYTALATDRTITFVTLTAARTLTLPAAAAYPTGTTLTIVDESGACSATNAITLARAGSDTINGATSTIIATAYGYLALESNGIGKWTIIDQTPAAGSGGGGNATVSRTPVNDANYTALTTDRTVAYAALTASRVVTLPAASAFATGAQLFVVDETGTCAPTRTITIARAGTDTINGAASALIASAYGFLAFTSNGSSKWTLVDLSGATQAQLTNRNAIINGNFAVNQRAYASGTALSAGTYAHDRWKAGSGGCTYTFTQAVPDTSVTISAGTLLQAVEGANVTAGSAWLSWSGTATARVWQGSAAGSYAASPILVTGLTVGTITNLEFGTGTLGLVQFEATLPGAGPTVFERRSAGAEVALCQRYYWVSAALAGGWGGQTTTITVAYTFPVTMRAAPQVTLLNGSVNSGSALELTVAQHVVSAVNANVINTSGGRTDLTTTAAAGTQRPGILEAGTLGFSAEL